MVKWAGGEGVDAKEKVARQRLSLLELAEALNNVSEAWAAGVGQFPGAAEEVGLRGVAPVQQPIEDGSSDDRVAQDIAPVAEALVAGQHDAAALAAGEANAEGGCEMGRLAVHLTQPLARQPPFRVSCSEGARYQRRRHGIHTTR